ncbi:xanthine dehydrogenase family protein molybdopterin-binding subunit [Cupriavidus plantarum]|uniref:xanthine dehydrogenase family protein molybdopterin-binding subunit n=1 Tax=Cupriavidus plantarum TaxID=942865 RepID=UPI00339D87A3
MLNRRSFVLGGTGAVALAIGWAVWHPDRRLTGKATASRPARGDIPLNGWVMIDADDNVTVVMCKAEMGQGIHTGAAMILADELGADWSRVRVTQAPIDSLYINREILPASLPFRPDDDGLVARTLRRTVRRAAPLAGSMATGGSTSIADLWTPMREAGACARAMLCAAAAKRWKVPADQCDTRDGKVFDTSGRSLTFGDLALAARDEAPPRYPALRPASRFTLIGKPVNRLTREAQSKLNGCARFGIDVQFDDMLYASVTMNPSLGGTLKRFDRSAVKHTEGVQGFYPVDGYNGGTAGIAVIASNPFIAMRALSELPVEWHPGPAAHLDTAAIRGALFEALGGDNSDSNDDGHTFYQTGFPDAALKQLKTVREMTYEVPYLAHGALEPVNCTVQVDRDTAHVWVSTQVPMDARRGVADVLGVGERDVHIHEQLLGGSFGRRLEVDFITQAAVIARHATPRPVQTIWSRAQDTTHDFYRPACVARFTGGLNARGELVAWRSASASQSIAAQVLPRAFGQPEWLARAMPDASMAEGAFDQPYECGNVSVRHHRVDLPFPVGYWRSVGHSHQAFFVESFLDEMAAAAGRDPLDFRLGMLTQGNHARHAAVLRAVAARSGWRAPHRWRNGGDEFARGLALHESFGSVVAQVAEIRRERRGQQEGFTVTRVFCAVDCGRAINPNLVAQQMESGIVYGLSAALGQTITVREGMVQQRYYTDYPMVCMATCPDIVVDVLASEAPPRGVGESGTPPIAPAVANALFALTGKRHRALPLLTPPQPAEGEDKWNTWCRSISTGNPPSSTPKPPLPCFGPFGATST